MYMYMRGRCHLPAVAYRQEHMQIDHPCICMHVAYMCMCTHGACACACTYACTWHMHTRVQASRSDADRPPIHMHAHMHARGICMHVAYACTCRRADADRAAVLVEVGCMGDDGRHAGLEHLCLRVAVCPLHRTLSHPAPTYVLTYLLTYLLTHVLTYLRTYLLTYLLTYSLTHRYVLYIVLSLILLLNLLVALLTYASPLGPYIHTYICICILSGTYAPS